MSSADRWPEFLNGCRESFWGQMDMLQTSIRKTKKAAGPGSTRFQHCCFFIPPLLHTSLLRSWYHQSLHKLVKVSEPWLCHCKVGLWSLPALKELYKYMLSIYHHPGCVHHSSATGIQNRNYNVADWIPPHHWIEQLTNLVVFPYKRVLQVWQTNVSIFNIWQ